MTPFRSKFCVPLHDGNVDYDVSLCELNLSESIEVVVDMEVMASVRRNVHGLSSSLCR